MIRWTNREIHFFRGLKEPRSRARSDQKKRHAKGKAGLGLGVTDLLSENKKKSKKRTNIKEKVETSLFIIIRFGSL